MSISALTPISYSRRVVFNLSIYSHLTRRLLWDHLAQFSGLSSEPVYRYFLKALQCYSSEALVSSCRRFYE